jgi:hypothetical protein
LNVFASWPRSLAASAAEPSSFSSRVEFIRVHCREKGTCEYSRYAFRSCRGGPLCRGFGMGVPTGCVT